MFLPKIPWSNPIKNSHATTNAPPTAKRQTDKLFVGVAVAMVATALSSVCTPVVLTTPHTLVAPLDGSDFASQYMIMRGIRALCL